VSKALQTVGLSDYYMERAVDKTLSGGERKKIELASILLMKPRLVILDEPDSGIDIASIEKIFQVMRILRDSGSSVILITHSPEILSQSEHAFLMCNGRIIERGNSKEISSNFRQKCMPCDHQNIAGDGYRWN